MKTIHLSDKMWQRVKIRAAKAGQPIGGTVDILLRQALREARKAGPMLDRPKVKA